MSSYGGGSQDGRSGAGARPPAERTTSAADEWGAPPAPLLLSPRGGPGELLPEDPLAAPAPTLGRAGFPIEDWRRGLARGAAAGEALLGSSRPPFEEHRSDCRTSSGRNEPRRSELEPRGGRGGGPPAALLGGGGPACCLEEEEVLLAGAGGGTPEKPLDPRGTLSDECRLGVRDR